MSGQAAYDWPTDLILPMRVSVGGEPWDDSSQETVQQYEKGQLVLQNKGVWYERPSADGTRKLYLYPAPGEALSLELEYVYRPVDLSISEPSKEPEEIPPEFHAAPLFYVAADYYRGDEDDPELAQVNEQLFDGKVAELVRYGNERGKGDGVFRVGIVGITA